MKKTLSILAIAGLVLALAPAAQAAPSYVDFVGDASALLNLAGRDVLAAVNFYDPDRIGDGQRTAGVIQGVDFDDFRINVDDTGSPIALSAGAAGATLSTVIAQGSGREFKGDNSADGNTNQTQIGTFSPVSADNTQAELLAQGGAFYQDNIASDLTFAFGAGLANTAVEVQMLGGGVWDKGSQKGILTASVGGVDLGYVEDQGYNMQLSTFDTTTDGSGNLLIDLTLTGDRYAILAGITVTAVPEPATMSLLAIGGLALLRRKRR